MRSVAPSGVVGKGNYDSLVLWCLVDHPLLMNLHGDESIYLSYMLALNKKPGSGCSQLFFVMEF